MMNPRHSRFFLLVLFSLLPGAALVAQVIHHPDRVATVVIDGFNSSGYSSTVANFD